MAFALCAVATGQTVVQTIEPPGLDATAFALWESGNRIVVADDASDTLYLFDPSTLAAAGSVPITLDSVGTMVIDEPTGKLYAACGCVGETSVIVVNLNTVSVHATITLPAPGTFARLAIDPVLHKVYVLYVSGLRQIDPAADSVTQVAGITGNLLRTMAVNATTGELYLSNMQYDELDIVDGVSLSVTTVSGLGAAGVAVNEQENKAYTAYPVYVYDRDTGTSDTIATGNDATAIFYNPASNRMYTTSEVNNQSTIIEGSDDSFVDFPLAPFQELAVREATNHVYISQPGGIGMFDDASRMLELIPLPGGAANGIVVRQSSGMIYALTSSSLSRIQDDPRLTRPPLAVYANGGFRLHMVDPVTHEMMATQTAGTSDLEGIAAMTSRIYVPKFTELEIFMGSGTRASDGLVAGAVFGPTTAVVSPDGSRVYVAGRNGRIGVVDPTTESTVNTFVANATCSSSSLSCPVRGLAVSPDGQKLYAADSAGMRIRVISTTSGLVTNSIVNGGMPWGVALNPAGTKLLVANADASGSVAVIDTSSEQVLAAIPVGSRPHGITVTPDGARAYVTNSLSNDISVIDLGSYQVIDTIVAPASPEGIAALPDGSAVYAVLKEAASPVRLLRMSVEDSAESTIVLDTTASNAMAIAIADPTSRIAGRVRRDACAVPGATIRVLQAGVQKGVATSNAAGEYSIFNLLPGTYDVEVNAAGFPLHVTNGVVASRGRTTIVSPAMPGGACPTPFGPPVDVNASATATTKVQVSWTPVAEAVSYEVRRKSHGGAYTIVGSPDEPAFLDTALTPSTTYVYVVRALDAAETESADSAPDAATTVLFTDDPVQPAITVKAAHMLQLQSAVNAFRACAGLGAVALTPAPATGGFIRASHIAGLRAGLAQARQLLGLSAVSYDDPTLTAGATRVKAVHVQQLRDAVK